MVRQPLSIKFRGLVDVKLPDQNGLSRLGRAVSLLCLITSLSRTHLNSQLTKEGGELQSFFATEQQRGSVLTYTQSYIDAQKERVFYTGTLYAGITLFKLDDCQMMVRAAFEDRYTGHIEHRSFGIVHFEPTGKLVDDTLYEYHLDLADLRSAEIRDLRAVPADLDINTNLRCQENSSCNLYWAQITATANKIAETRTVNGIRLLDKKTASIVLPMASQDSAVQATKLLSAAIRACPTISSSHE